MSKDDLLAALSSAHDDLLIAADVAVTQGYRSPEGWGVGEVLAHIAAWEEEAAARIPTLLAGAPSQSYDEDAFNAAAVATAAGWPLHLIRDRLKSVHSHLLAVLDGLDDKEFTSEGVAYDWVTSLTSHSHHHAHEIVPGQIEPTD